MVLDRQAVEVTPGALTLFIVGVAEMMK